MQVTYPNGSSVEEEIRRENRGVRSGVARQLIEIVEGILMGNRKQHKNVPWPGLLP